MIISHRYRFVFVHVPKTAGDSITAALRPIADPGHASPPDCPDKHLTACEIRRQYFTADSWSSYFSFAFIRNPWDWLHSDYWFCVSHAATILARADRDATSWVTKLRRVQRMTFSEFVRTEWTTSPCRAYCQDAGVDLVSFIGRYDNLHTDFEAITRKIGLTPVPPLGNLNTTVIDGKPRPPYQQDYTPKLRRIVADRFAYEIERFGYEFG